MKIDWQTAKTYEDILYHKADGIAKITSTALTNATPSVPKPFLNSTTPLPTAREDTNIGVVLFTAGPHTDGKYAFCAGGDQSVRGTAGM